MDKNLYNYLCEIVGTDDIVEIKRHLFKMSENYRNANGNPFRCIYSGSKAEGLDLQGSDLDIMIIDPTFSVSDNILESNSNTVIVDTAETSPGYVILRPNMNNCEADFIVNTVSGKLLSNEKFKQYWLKKISLGVLHIHGPCLSSPAENYDFAFCLQGYFWPNIASQWIIRPRNTELLPELKSDILRDGILFVPIGSKFGSTTDNKNEWRMSFSQAEKRLVHSFNHTELLCYALLKIVLKEVFNQNTMVKGLLCSYYLKTAMFWLKEELPSDTWKPLLLYHCFKECLKRLFYWIECGYCPNYFVPENNMFAGKFENARFRTTVVKTLQNICDDYLALFTNSKTLYGFLSNHRITEKKGGMISNETTSVCELDAHVFPLTHIFTEYFWRTIYTEILEQILPILNSNRKSNIRSRYSDMNKYGNELNIFMFAKECQLFCVHMRYNFNICNNMLYMDYKNLLSHLLIGTHSGITAWLSVALFFYQHKEYNNAIKVADFCISQITPDMTLLGLFCKQFSQARTTETEFYQQLSLLQRFKLTCKNTFNVQIFHKSYLYDCNLGIFACMYAICNEHSDRYQILKQFLFNFFQRSESADYILMKPETLGQFIRFMCYHNQLDSTKRDRCLDEMIKTIIGLPEDSHYRNCSSPYLLRALALVRNASFKESAEYAADICFS